MLAKLRTCFKECGLELHPNKTKIVYCKDGNRRQKQPNKSFDFLGYEFRVRGCKNKTSGKLFTGFTPAASKGALKLMRATIKESNLRNRSDINLNEIAQWFNPILQGWLNYYGKYNMRLMLFFKGTVVG